MFASERAVIEESDQIASGAKQSLRSSIGRDNRVELRTPLQGRPAADQEQSLRKNNTS